MLRVKVFTVSFIISQGLYSINLFSQIIGNKYKEDRHLLERELNLCQIFVYLT